MRELGTVGETEVRRELSESGLCMDQGRRLRTSWGEVTLPGKAVLVQGLTREVGMNPQTNQRGCGCSGQQGASLEA